VNIELSSALEQIIDSKIARGEYKDREDLIKQAVLLLTEQDQLKLQKLNESLSIGIEQIKRGEVFELDALDDIHAEIDTRMEKTEH